MSRRSLSGVRKPTQHQMFEAAEVTRARDFAAKLPYREQLALAEFKALNAPAEVDPIIACWFLKGEDWNASKTLPVYQQSLAWRKAERVDALRTQPDRVVGVGGGPDKVFARGCAMAWTARGARSCTCPLAVLTYLSSPSKASR